MDRLKQKSTWIGLGILVMEAAGMIFPEVATEIRAIGVPILAGTDVIRQESTT